MKFKIYTFLLGMMLVSGQTLARTNGGAVYQALVAEFYLQEHEYEKSFSAYEKLAKISDSDEVLKRLSDISLVIGDLKLIEKSSAIIMAKDPNNISASTNHLVALAGQAKHQTATVHIKKLYQLIKTQKSNKFSVLEMVKKLSLVKNKKIVSTLLEQLFATIKPDKEDWFALATFYSMHSKYDEALDKVEKSIALDPSWADSSILKSRIFYTQGFADKAVDFMGKFYKQNYSLKAGEAYGRMLSSTGKFKTAVKVYEKLLQKKKTPALQDSLAGLYANLKQYKKAAKIYQSLTAEPKLNDKANYFLGIINQELGKLKQAKENLQEVTLGEYYLDARLALAGLIAKTDIKEAIESLDNIHDIDLKSYSKIVLAKAEIYQQADDLKKAYEIYTEAIDENYDSDLYYARAILAEKMGRIDSMEEDLLIIIENDPNDVDALNALGYSLADKSDRHLEALSYIEKALKIEPNKFYILDSMGWVQYKLGRFDKALSYLLQAYKRKADPEVAAHLTEVFWHTGDKTKANKYLKLGNDLNAEHPAILKVKDMLKDKGISH